MRKVMAFLVWLFSFWTWKDFFLRCLAIGSHGDPPSRPPSASAHTATAELPPSQAKEQESEFSRFLSSLPEDCRSCEDLEFLGDSQVVAKFDGGLQYHFRHGADVEAGHRYSELLEAAASSQLLFSENLSLDLQGTESCVHTEALAKIFRQSAIRLRTLAFRSIDEAHNEGFRMRFAKCLSSVLLGQDGLEDLHVVYNGICDEERGGDVVAELCTNIHTLARLKSFRIFVAPVDEERMQQLLNSFNRPHSVLEQLKVDYIASDEQLECIGGLLATTTSLKSLELDTRESEEPLTRGFHSIAAALGSNQSVKTLICRVSSSMELKALLDPLIPKDNKPQSNTTLTELELMGSIGGKEGMETLVHLIHTNTSLLKLDFNSLEEFHRGVRSDSSKCTENVLTILEALKTNKSLKTIPFGACDGVGGYKVLGAMMDLLLENHWIQDIDLRNTSLEKCGDAEYVRSELEKRRKMKMWGVVQGMANVKPTSGRVFLCGEPYAGKTRLRTTIKTLEEFENLDENPSSSRFKRWQNKNFKRPKASNVAINDQPLERTHGIEVDNVQCDGIGISIWDMAGQTDYHSFHELVMPNLSADGSSSLFMLVCNPVEPSYPFGARNLLSIKEELETWLRFIASNTRRSRAYRPHVSIVMTHYDYWKGDALVAKCIEDAVNDLKIQFQEVLEFDEDKVTFKVDGANGFHARCVFDFIKSHLKQLLERLPKTISACQEVQKCVAKWNSDKTNLYLLRWDEFCEKMCKDVEDLKDGDDEVAEKKKEFVAMSLNDGGHIIYNEKEGVVITNPHWFCHSIMGEFLHQCVIRGRKLAMVSSNGIISHSDAKHCLLSLLEGQENVGKKFDDIFNMMMKLHVCYEQDENHIIIPSALIDKHDTLSWCELDGSSIFNYVGRRLACKDGKKTMLTLGFFTRLQVSFYKKLDNKNAQESYQLFGDVIKFINNGIEVILQFTVGDIDILLRSDHPQDTMIDFLNNFIVLHIRHLQVDPTLGCPGVLLEEFVLRPACVRCLVHSNHRKNQCVSMGDLDFQVVKNGLNATYNWKPCEGLGVGFDKVKTLLGDSAWTNLLKRRSLDLQECQEKMEQLVGSIGPNVVMSVDKKGGSSSPSLWPSLGNLVFGRVYEELDNIKGGQVEIRRIQDENHKEVMLKLDHLERGIKKMEGELLPAICSKIDDLMAFSTQFQISQIPKLAYLCEIGKKKLLTRFVPGLDNIQLHFMCESVHGFHRVTNQKGHMVSFGTEDTKKFLAMISWGLKIVTILTKVGAHVACGMGAMVPDFSDAVSYGALVLDSGVFLDYRVPSSSLESLPFDAKKFSTIPIKDILETQRWLQDVLEPECRKRRAFHEKFRLSKVKYHGSSGPIAWICDECVSNHQNEFDALI